MGLSILTNVPALTVARHLEAGADKAAKAMERLSSGKRINRPGDDAAGLSLGFSLDATVRSLDQAKRNAEDGLSLIQTAGGGLNEVGNILVRMRELAIQAASDTIGDQERSYLQTEANLMEQEVERIANSTKYLDTQLLNGQGRSFEFFVGADSNESSIISYDAAQVDIRPDTLGVEGLDLSDKDSAKDAFEKIDQGIKQLGLPMAIVGANQARIQIAISHIRNYAENLAAARSRVMDADLAKESTEVVKSTIQQRAAIAVLAQANTIPQLALKLIEGV